MGTRGEGFIVRPSPDGKRAHTAGLRVLVVDDDRDVADAIGFFVRLLGHEVTVETDSAQAVEVALAVTPHVVFLDIGMPNMDGLEVARRMKAEPRLAGTVLIAASGYTGDDVQCQARDAGFDDYWPKPFDMGQIEKVLAACANPEESRASVAETRSARR